MKASEALKISNRASKDIPGYQPETLVRGEDGEIHHLLGGTVVRHMADSDLPNVAGDWEPLGLVTPLDDVPRHDVVIRTLDGERHKYPAILEQDLTNRCLVRESEDDTMAKLYHDAAAKVDTLTAKVAELEGERKLQTAYEGASNLLTEKKNLEAELSSLRSQQVLGEALPEGSVLDIDGMTYLVLEDGGFTQHTIEDHEVIVPSAKTGLLFYLDPRQLPALPTPVEEVGSVRVKIPDWLTPKGLLIRDSGTVVAVAEVRGQSVSGINEWGNFGQWPLENFRICDLPVRHPDGTIAPIEPTAELRAALKGGESDAQ